MVLLVLCCYEAGAAGQMSTRLAGGGGGLELACCETLYLGPSADVSEHQWRAAGG